jgi:hypothetical protein
MWQEDFDSKDLVMMTGRSVLVGQPIGPSQFLLCGVEQSTLRVQATQMILYLLNLMQFISCWWKKKGFFIASLKIGSMSMSPTIQT